MTFSDINFSEWSAVLPQHFQFYHLGEVSSKALFNKTENPLKDALAVGYQIKGDIQAVVLVIFDRGLDLSVYSELGNVLASQIANQLHSQKGFDVLISPPQILSESLFENIQRSQKPLLKRTYAHVYHNFVIPIETWILKALPEGVGHA